MKTVCDHCGAIVGQSKYDLSITAPTGFKDFRVCSKECLKNILHQNGIATYPNMKGNANTLSKVALVISVFSILIQIIRTIFVLL